jgi:ribosomal protein L18E
MPSILDIKTRVNPAGRVRALVEYLEIQQKGISGDMVLVASPIALGSSAAAVTAAIAGAAAKFTRDVTIKLQTAAGEVHSWFNGTFAIAVAEVTAGSGVSAIAGGVAVATFVNGVATVTINYTGVWAAADTQTLTITGSTKLGYAITNKTSVDTLIA